MTRRFVNELGESESINEIYLLADRQLRANRNGNLYLQLRLADRTGMITGMMWNANDRIYGNLDNGNFVRVQATTQYYNGALQMIVSQIDRADAGEVDPLDFETLRSTDVDRLTARLIELLRGLDNEHLRNLAECFLMDEQFMTKFTRAPAGIKNHHAYQSGLLEHVVSLMELTTAVAPCYPGVDGELLLIGAFLHDIGKIEELTYQRELAYSDEGQLIGHLVLGIELLDEKARRAEELAGEAMPEQLLLRLKHMILSHHGQYEFGSPKLPMTLEAIALHYLDSLDAKLHSVGQIMEDDVNKESVWTSYQPNMGRKFFKGGS